MLDLQLLFIAGSHPGVPVIKEMQPFVACAQYVPPVPGNYAWFEATACMDDGSSSYDTCIKKVNMPSSQLSNITSCMQDTALSSKLVTAMNKKATDTLPGQAYPWVQVKGTSMPEPDMHGDDAGPTIEAICAAYTGTKAACCSGITEVTANSTAY